MISVDNVPLNNSPCDADFTVDSYRDLLATAKLSYVFASYSAIPWGERFVLWRHDCDYSLNRAHALACVEAEEGVRATYFLNPHCEFYNLFEKSQYRLVREIIEMGHEIGLHFDAAFHDVSDEVALGQLVASEAELLDGLYGVKPSVFSFHNPFAAHLSYEAESYGGLINSYSRRFKTEVPYCSDSNGYWRFRRLHNVLADATDSCLQVLTHPGWWQKTAMSPRQRIFRSVYGRAKATMGLYEAGLDAHGRQNISGAPDTLRLIRAVDPDAWEFCDLLWNRGDFAALFVELWRHHERQINQLCKAVFRKDWRVPAADVNAFFEDRSLVIDGWRLFNAVFGGTWQQAARVDGGQYKDWVALRNSLIHGRSTAPGEQLEEGCVFLCRAIEALAAWGQSQPMAYDGIRHLGSIGIPTYKTADGSLTDRLEEIADEVPGFSGKRWERFKAYMQKVGAGEVAE
jgi:peptidoglycan/xylan/chitin deacetylase (PgdA/CDA1 family)